MPEKCDFYFSSFVWLYIFWEKYKYEYLLYEMIYGELNACMPMVYDF